MAENLKHKKAFRAGILRSFSQSAGINSETMQGLGYGFAMIPLLKELYAGDELRDAVVRESAFFNTYPGSVGYIYGITAKYEEQHAADPTQASEQMINQLKVSLMGPLAGLGDSLMMAVFRMIVTVIAVDFALSKNLIGPVFFLFVFHALYLFLRIKGAYVGYKEGPLYLQQFMDNGTVERLTRLLGMIKAAMIGYLVYRAIQIPIPDSWHFIDETLGQVLPHWLALIVVCLGVILYKKNLGQKYVVLLVAVVSLIVTLFLV